MKNTKMKKATNKRIERQKELVKTLLKTNNKKIFNKTVDELFKEPLPIDIYVPLELKGKGEEKEVEKDITIRKITLKYRFSNSVNKAKLSCFAYNDRFNVRVVIRDPSEREAFVKMIKDVRSIKNRLADKERVDKLIKKVFPVIKKETLISPDVVKKAIAFNYLTHNGDDVQSITSYIDVSLMNTTSGFAYLHEDNKDLGYFDALTTAEVYVVSKIKFKNSSEDVNLYLKNFTVAVDADNNVKIMEKHTEPYDRYRHMFKNSLPDVADTIDFLLDKNGHNITTAELKKFITAVLPKQFGLHFKSANSLSYNKLQQLNSDGKILWMRKGDKMLPYTVESDKRKLTSKDISAISYMLKLIDSMEHRRSACICL